MQSDDISAYEARIKATVDPDGQIRSQTTLGERSAIEGLLCRLKPDLTLEIGTAEGGTLKILATHSGQVHSFDLEKPDPELEILNNVSFHTGDSHVLLPTFLAELEKQKQTVDFAFVDGDHTADGIRQDLSDLLSSSTTDHSVILIHDTFNEEVREGVQSCQIRSYEKVRYFDLDFVTGHVGGPAGWELEMWGGIGLVVTDTNGNIAELGTMFDDPFEIVSNLRKGTP